MFLIHQIVNQCSYQDQISDKKIPMQLSCNSWLDQHFPVDSQAEQLLNGNAFSWVSLSF